MYKKILNYFKKGIDIWVGFEYNYKPWLKREKFFEN